MFCFVNFVSLFSFWQCAVTKSYYTLVKFPLDFKANLCDTLKVGWSGIKLLYLHCVLVLFSFRSCRNKESSCRLQLTASPRIQFTQSGPSRWFSLPLWIARRTSRSCLSVTALGLWRAAAVLKMDTMKRKRSQHPSQSQSPLWSAWSVGWQEWPASPDWKHPINKTQCLQDRYTATVCMLPHNGVLAKGDNYVHGFQKGFGKGGLFTNDRFYGTTNVSLICLIEKNSNW